MKPANHTPMPGCLSRDEAKAAGHFRFLSNNSCLRCGGVDRYVRNSSCCHCQAEASKPRPVEWTAWDNIKQRTKNPNNPMYAQYGGRGIKMCPKWRASFNAFLQDVGPRPVGRYSIGRIDVDGNYEPGNVRWETDKQQSRSTTRTIWVEVGGERMVLRDAAIALGLNYSGLRDRIKIKGMSFEEAVRVARGARSKPYDLKRRSA